MPGALSSSVLVCLDFLICPLGPFTRSYQEKHYNLFFDKSPGTPFPGTVNISRVENGHVFPSAETIESFAEALGIEVKDLFAFKEKVMVADTSDKKRVISLAKKAKPKQAKLIYAP